MSKPFLLGYCLAAWALAPCGLLVGTSAAATKAERSQRAQEKVEEALQREVYGWEDDRQRLLDEALQEDEHFAPARWHQGFVRHQDQWKKADEVVEQAAEDQRLDAYEQARQKHADTPEGQWALAKWCRHKKLVEQERAHLMRVLQLQPDHAAARVRLGFRRVDGQWIDPSETREAQEQAAQLQRSLARWQPQLENRLKSLRNDNPQRRELAAERIREITDPEAIPALEHVLSTSGEDAALLVVEVLSNMSSAQATLSLARHAILSPSMNVRQAASEELKGRELHAFVPQLLANLYSPVTSQLDIFRGERGRLLYRHRFLREGQDHRELMIAETQYQRRAAPGNTGEESLLRAMTSIALWAQQRETAVARQNELTQVLNDRIATTLNTVTDQALPASPEDWWSWWTDENEVYMTGSKPTRYVYRTRQVTVEDRLPRGLGSQTMDCLAAGTVVWTIRGLVAIEEIQVGDLVLSQHPETGELAYKPVLRTTVRPMSRLVKVESGGETIETSGGHLFWVAGRGWTKARKLEPGMLLHGVDGTAHVSQVEEGSQQQTYNLVVDQFHSYFVGKSRILSHDNTVRRSTEAIVPGLVQ